MNVSDDPSEPRSDRPAGTGPTGTAGGPYGPRSGVGSVVSGRIHDVFHPESMPGEGGILS